MTSQVISLDEIDFENERFRISEELDSAAMLDSLREIGQLNPVLLLDTKASGKVIICGFRRLHALRQMGRMSVLCRILEADESDPAGIYRLALWDNLSHRQLDPLEKARVLFTLN